MEEQKKRLLDIENNLNLLNEDDRAKAELEVKSILLCFVLASFEQPLQPFQET